MPEGFRTRNKGTQNQILFLPGEIIGVIWTLGVKAWNYLGFRCPVSRDINNRCIETN